MKELTELKQELETLEVDRAELVARYAVLQETERNAPTDFNHLGHPIGSSDKRDAEADRMAVGRQLAAIEARAGRVAKRVTYLENLAAADAEIGRAQKAEEAAAARIARLGASLGRVTASLEQMKVDAAQELEQLQCAEQDAARAQAQATASGDEKAAKEARAQMDAVVTARRETGARHDANEHIARALEAEAGALRQQLGAAEADQKKAATAANTAQCLKVGAEWDQVVGRLQEVGARLVSLGVDYPLSTLKVPTFAPNSSEVTRESLRHLAQQRVA